MKIKAFTLAEIMIVLTIIGVLAGILVPIATQNRPDENVMKFKKADTTFGNVIRALVSNDKYFCNGYLGQKADCTTWVTFTVSGNYICRAMADMLSAKKVNCWDGTGTTTSARLLSNESVPEMTTEDKITKTVTDETIQATKEFFDSTCKSSAPTVGAEIITPDGIAFYQSGSISWGTNHSVIPYGTPPSVFPANISDEKGFDIFYKIFCFDVDGIPSTATSSDCKNECPFGYGVRADGKILPGARAEEWFGKSLQGND